MKIQFKPSCSLILDKKHIITGQEQEQKTHFLDWDNNLKFYRRPGLGFQKDEKHWFRVKKRKDK